MPRIARVVIPNAPHHITHRGNNRQATFFVDDDRRVYLDTLREQCSRFGVALAGYCLMTNHVHLVLIPRSADGLARAVGQAHRRHSNYINRLRRRSGHLWANRFYSCPLDDVHFWRTMVYVERNPVRARLVRRAWRYPWSSAAAHVGEDESGGDGGAGMLEMAAWRQAARRLNWRNELTRPEDEDVVRAIRACTWAGRPLGTDSFVAKIESRLGRRLRALPPGRPRKKTKKAHRNR